MKCKVYKDMFADEGSAAGADIPTSIKEYLERAANGDEAVLNHWKNTAKPNIFAVWDKKNLKKEISPINGLVLIKENSAGFVPYLYHPKADRGMSYFANRFYEIIKERKSEIVQITNRLNEKYKMSLSNMDVAEYIKRFIRERHADWIAGVSWCKNIDWIFDIDFNRVYGEIEKLCELSVEYRQKKSIDAVDDPALLKKAIKTIKNIFDEREKDAWDEYGIYLTLIGYVSNKETFDWILNEYFKDKINYFCGLYPTIDFYENVDKLIRVSLKDFSSYLDIISTICREEESFNPCKTDVVGVPVDDKYGSFIQDCELDILNKAVVDNNDVLKGDNL